MAGNDPDRRTLVVGGASLALVGLQSTGAKAGVPSFFPIVRLLVGTGGRVVDLIGQLRDAWPFRRLFRRGEPLGGDARDPLVPEDDRVQENLTAISEAFRSAPADGVFATPVLLARADFDGTPVRRFVQLGESNAHSALVHGAGGKVFAVSASWLQWQFERDTCDFRFAGPSGLPAQCDYDRKDRCSLVGSKQLVAAPSGETRELWMPQMDSWRSAPERVKKRHRRHAPPWRGCDLNIDQVTCDD